MLEALTALVGVVDLLLEYSVLFSIDIFDDSLCVFLQVSLKLFVLLLAPLLSLFLVRFGILFSLLLLLFGSRGLSVANIVQAIHVILSLHNQVVVVLALEDPLIGSKNPLELLNLLV